jgi:signal transduction histidine kinase
MKKFAAHLQNVREEERILLAREIHDELGQILSAIKIDLGLLIHCMSKEKGIGSCDKIMNPINDIYKLVDKTILTARKIMSELRPEVLDTIGFIEAVRSYIIDYQNRYKIECDFNTSVSELKLTSQQSIALYRICQEALSNVAKHAEASLVNIDLDIKGANLIMVISDNGKGMSVRQKTRMDSYGLIGMRERVFLLEGEMIIISEPGKGTSIKISVPYLLNVALNK